MICRFRKLSVSAHDTYLTFRSSFYRLTVKFMIWTDKMPNLKLGLMFFILGGVQEEAVASWSEHNFPSILVTFDSNWWHFITADMPMNLQAQLHLCSSCGSWVMLQIVSKWKFFLKRSLSQELPYRQPNKKMAYLTFHKWLVSVCNIHNDIMNGTNQNQSLGKSELRYYFIRLTICT